MHSETSQTEDTVNNHRKSPHGRGNFSKCGKLCDQTFYLEGGGYDWSSPINSKKSPRTSTTAFTSVSRQTNQNFRFSIPLPVGQFTNHPDHMYGRSKSPSWSFPKKQRYGNQKVEQYEICKKHPIAKHQNQEVNFKSTSTIKQTLRSNLSLLKKTSLNQTMDQTRNYSILLPRRTSAVDFFSKTKIKNPLYLSKKQIMNQEQKLQTGKQIQPCPKGYIQFFKKRPRQPNKNVKGFQTFLSTYNHQKQFKNFSKTQYPVSPTHHIDFEKHLDRDTDPKPTYGPNLSLLNIDPIRVNFSNIDLNLRKFRSKITTRYDRVGPEPNTRIDYDPPQNDLGGMVKMQVVIGRNRQLFPIVDPAIKKAGDKEAREILRSHIPIKQINQAMRPKCNQKIQI